MSEMDPGQPALPDMELENIIQAMPIENRIQEKRRLLEEIAERESLIATIDKINVAEGADVTIIY